MQISNPGPGILYKLFGGSDSDGSASILFAGSTSATPTTVTTHNVPTKFGTVLVQNNGRVIIYVSENNGASYSAVAAGASLLITSLPYKRVMIYSASASVPYVVRGTAQAYSLPSVVRVGSDSDADFATITAAEAVGSSVADIRLEAETFSENVDISTFTTTLTGSGPTTIIDGDITLGYLNQASGFIVAAGNTITLGADVFTTAQDTLIDDVLEMWRTNTIVVPGGLASTPHEAVALISAGQDVRVDPDTYTGTTLTVPTGVNIIGSGSNCIFQFDVVLEGTASIKGVLMDDGYTITQDGVVYS